MKKTKQSVLQLQPEQQKVLELSPKGAVLIKGVAGSGKTTVAVYRVKYLIENYPSLFSQTNVAIFTYNRLLANYMQGLVDEVVGFKSAKVSNFHKWAYAFIEQRVAGICANTIANVERHVFPLLSGYLNRVIFYFLSIR
ncbi:MAG: UvrD-helicase domain-containing protein [Phocaeicola sp.]